MTGARKAGATGGEDALARWSPSAEAGATWQAVLGGKAAREQSWGLLRASIHAGREEAAAVVPMAQASFVFGEFSLGSGFRQLSCPWHRRAFVLVHARRDTGFVQHACVLCYRHLSPDTCPHSVRRRAGQQTAKQ